MISLGFEYYSTIGMLKLIGCAKQLHNAGLNL